MIGAVATAPIEITPGEALRFNTMSTENAIYTKEECLQLLSKQLRREDLEPLQHLKIMNIYAKLRGWFDGAQDPSPQKNVAEMVEELERKRREETHPTGTAPFVNWRNSSVLA